ncbi:MAG TPA: protein YgfX [Gallionella sp.]|nr:protein YgfX [Gallionella sp.]
MAIHPSPRFVFLLLFSHSLAAGAAYVTVMPSAFKIVIFPLLLLSVLYHLARDALVLLPDSWCGLSVKQGEVSVLRRDAGVMIGNVVDGTFVSPYFVLLRLRIEGRRWLVSRVIFPDALERDVFRDLCVRLRLG